MTIKTTNTNESKHQTQNPLLRFALRRFFETINEMMPEVDQLLDAGCGEGYGVREMLDQHPRMKSFGVDIAYPAVMKVAEISPTTAVSVADVTRLPLRDNCVDLVTSFEVLEHLAQPDAAVRDYRRVSRRYVLISTPNEPMFRLLRMVRGDNFRQWGNHPEHVNHWNSYTLARFLSRQGLKVLRVASPPPFIWTIVLCEVLK
ncbi:MAG: class I SAM-dependent methyltransferase [Anaerolineae bacterium]|nr:class I SAM-dependent methyltransferase [Anaerolineae bacterium]